MLDRTSFEQVVDDKVVTIYLLAEQAFKVDPHTVKVPFFIPERQERIFDDFKKTVGLKLKEKYDYQMSDFVPNEYNIIFRGIERFVNITRK